MNRISAIALLGLGLLLAPVATTLVGTQTADAVPGQVRIGVIDLENTLYQTPAGKRASEKFDQGRKSKQAEFDKKQKDLQKAAGELDKQAAVLKPDVLATKRKALEEQFAELQKLYVKLERSLAEDRAKLIQELLKQAEPLIAKLAKQEGVQLIVDRSAVLYAQADIDLTAKLNAQMK